MSFPAVASFSGLQLHNVPMKEKQIAFVMGEKNVTVLWLLGQSGFLTAKLPPRYSKTLFRGPDFLSERVEKHNSLCLRARGGRNMLNSGRLLSVSHLPASRLPPRFAEESTRRCSSWGIFHVVVKRMMGA